MSTSPTAICRIEMLGELRVTLPGGATTTRFLTRKAAGLLAFLALRMPRPQPREALVELFWPEQDLPAARNSLSVALASLRRQLETPAATGSAAGTILVSDRTQVGLNPAAVETDVAEFDRTLDRAERAADPAERGSLYAQAAALYRGDLLPGFYDDWAAREQARVQSRLLDALRRWAADGERAGDAAGAVAALERAAALDPYDEDVCRARMRLHAAAGRAAKAAEIYREAAALWESEFGSPPPAETRRLAAALGVPADGGRPPSAPPRTTAARPAPTPKPLEPPASPPPSPADPASVPAAKARPAAPPPLPLVLTRFFGREGEIAFLDSALREFRLVTVTGPGGTGKTRLAVEAARRAREAGGGAAAFVPFADLTDPRGMAERIAAAFGLPPDPSEDCTAAALAERLNAAGGGKRPLLAILDNLEQLLPGADAKGRRAATAEDDAARFVHDLLERAPRLTCLCTSRRRLGLRGERELPLEPLPVPEGDAPDPAALLAVPSVQLYVDRATAARPDFAVTPGNAAAVAGLARRLEGSPLALELAAAWVRTLPPASMLRRIEGRLLAVPEAREKDVPERHQSLSAALDWSYALLGAPQQRLFARLSVFAGGWTVDAAEAVCGEPDALEALAELEASSLVRTIVEGDSGDVRYRFPEAIRAYAAERLRERDGDEAVAAARRRHADFFRDLLREARPHLVGAEQAEWMARIGRDLDNVRLMLDARQTAPGVAGAEAALEMVTALQQFWQVRGYWHEGRARTEAVLRRPDADPAGLSPKGIEWRALALRGVANIAIRLGDLDGALRANQECLGLLRERRPDDRVQIGRAIVGIAITHLLRGEYAEAEPLYREALALFREAGSRVSVANVLNDLAIIAQQTGDDARARSLYEEALAIDRTLDRPENLANGLSNLGPLLVRMGDLDAGRACIRECLELCIALDDRRDGIYALLGAAKLILAEARQTSGDALAKGTAAAARLYAAEAGVREAMGALRAPADVPGYEDAVAALRADLTPDAFTAAWEAGRRLSWQDAAAEALAHCSVAG